MTRNPDRLVLFTDAVVAIAVTLLILPLVDVVTESQAEGHDAVAVITEHKPQIYTFLLSFLVITRFWLTHHRLFEHVRAYNRTLIQLNMVWLLFIVIQPFPTEIIGIYPSDQFTAGLYIGTIVALSLCQTALALLIRGHRELEQPDNPVTDHEVMGAVTFSILGLIAFLLAAFVPGVDFYALFLLFLGPIANRISNAGGGGRSSEPGPEAAVLLGAQVDGLDAALIDRRQRESTDVTTAGRSACVHDRSVVTAVQAATVDPYCASGYSRCTFTASAAPTMSVSSRG